MSDSSPPLDVLREILAIMHGGEDVSASGAFRDLKVAEHFALVLEQSFKASVAKDGTCDYLVQAAHLIRLLKE